MTFKNEIKIGKTLRNFNSELVSLQGRHLLKMKTFYTFCSFSLAARQYDTVQSGSGDSGQKFELSNLRNDLWWEKLHWKQQLMELLDLEILVVRVVIIQDLLLGSIMSFSKSELFILIRYKPQQPVILIFESISMIGTIFASILEVQRVKLSTCWVMKTLV